MFESFINELREKASQLGLEEEGLVSTYQKWYQLGVDAGLSEEEIVNRFGRVEDILKPSLKPIEVSEGFNLLEVSTAASLDVLVEQGARPAVEFEDENDEKYFDVVVNDREISVKEKDKGRKFKGVGDVTITIPEGAFFKKVEFNLVSADVQIDADLSYEKLDISVVSSDVEVNGLLKGKTTEMNTVSGDVDIETLVTLDMSISTVSGDFNIDSAAIKKLNVTTVSGNIDINGNVEKADTTSVSGEININHQSQKTSLKDVLGQAFRF